MPVCPYDADLEPDKAEAWFQSRYAAYEKDNPWKLVRKRNGKLAAKIAALDFETDPFDGPGQVIKPFVGGFYDGETYHYFWGDDCVERIVAHIRALDTPHIIYAHNGGKFDFLLMLDHIEPEVFCIGTRIVKAMIVGEKEDNVTGDTITHELRDSYSLLPVPLADAAIKNNFDYANMKKSLRNKWRDKIVEYLKQDCVGLYDTITKARNEFGNALTMASAAMKKLNLAMAPKRKRGERIAYQRLSAEQEERLRPFYFGGRVQCFDRGIFKSETDKPWKLFDITSSYPNVMKNYLHPISSGYVKGLRDITKHTDFAHIEAWSVGEFGCLPKRADDGSLHFPTGKHHFFATGHEIRMGLELGWHGTCLHAR